MRFANVFVVLALSTVIAGQPSGRGSTPNVFYAAHAQERVPLFIAASAAFDSAGAPTQLLPNAWRQEHERVRAMESVAHARAAAGRGAVSEALNPCDLRQNEPDVEYPVRDTVAATVRNATAIFEGSISEVTPGFFYGHPGSLLRVTSVRTLKKSADYAAVTDTLYARYPLAVFAAGDVRYCAGFGTPTPPIGARVLIFAFGRPLDEAGKLVFSFRNDILLDTAGGAVFPPLLDVFRTAGARTFEDVETIIMKSIVRENPHEVRQ